MSEWVRHAPLLAKISLVVVLGIFAIGLFPIGFDQLFPLKNDLKGRRLWSGLFITSISLGSLGTLFGLIFCT